MFHWASHLRDETPVDLHLCTVNLRISLLSVRISVKLSRRLTPSNQAMSCLVVPHSELRMKANGFSDLRGMASPSHKQLQTLKTTAYFMISLESDLK